MTYFLYQGELEKNRPAELQGREVRHIRLARKIRPGEVVHIQDSLNKRYSCLINWVKNSAVGFTPQDEIQILTKNNFPIYLALAYAKEKALEFVFQKATELGVEKIFLFESQYSLRSPAKVVLENKLQRWERITAEACKQCDRAIPPEIKPTTVDELNELSLELGLTGIKAHPDEVLLDIPEESKGTLIYIGPEGGFGPLDLPTLPQKSLYLGPLLLRCETAALASVSIVQHLKGCFRPCTK